MRLARLCAAALAIAAAAGAAHAERKNDTHLFQFEDRYDRPPTLSYVAQDASERPMLSPASERVMQEAIARYEIITARGGWQPLTGGWNLGPRSSGAAVVILRRRMVAEGYLPPEEWQRPDTFDATLEAAVKRYQENNGLYVTGKVDEMTRKVLNVPASERLAALRANLLRVREFSKGLGARYVVVNIPAAQMEIVQNGSVFSRHNIIAGKIERPSPTVSSNISELNFNPYWNAPASIVEKDILPKLRVSTQVLKQQNIRIYDGVGGPEIDPRTVDWSEVPADRYVFRQEPGEENAMASVKINFPSPFGVYMHDTPTKTLFKQSARYFSSGCVRVDKVHVFTSWLLNGQDGWNDERIQSVAASGERLDVKLRNPVPLRWVYLTAWVTEDGQAHFRPDIYQLDKSGFVAGQPPAIGTEEPAPVAAQRPSFFWPFRSAAAPAAAPSRQHWFWRRTDTSDWDFPENDVEKDRASKQNTLRTRAKAPAPSKPGPLFGQQ